MVTYTQIAKIFKSHIIYNPLKNKNNEIRGENLKLEHPANTLPVP